VGALFGQTEGLLDSEMDLKQLQKSGRIGRIGLEVDNKRGKTVGKITIPSSLNKIETAIIAATLESVDRVGPCECKITLNKIADVRKEKRDKITKRASEIMKQWDVETHEQVKDIPATVEKGAKRGRIITFGPDRLPAGPDIYQSHEIILVEGRADVANLIKMDIQNTIAIDGTKISQTIKNLCKNRNVTALLDGDRGGDMILKELLHVASIEYVARAPYKKEIEDLGFEDVSKALKNKVAIDQAKFMTEDKLVSDFMREQKISHRNRVSSPAQRSGDQDQSRSKSPRHRTSSKPRRGFSGDKQGRSSSTETSQKTRESDRDSYQGSRQKSQYRERKSSTRDKFKSRGRQQTGKGRFSRFPKVHVAQALKSLIDSTKQTLNAVFSIIIDGVITQRFLDMAHKKSVQLIAGAAVGELTTRYEQPQITTFNRI
jgi:DNA primase